MPNLAEALQAAKAAAGRREWSAALAAFEEIAQTWPASVEGPIGMARALRYLKRLDDADAAILPVLKTYPGNVHAALEYGWIAIFRRDWEQAVSRWLFIITAFPENPYVLGGAAKALIDASHLPEAVLLLRAARQRFPDVLELMERSIEAAQGQMDWPAVAALCDELGARFPDHPRARELLVKARFAQDFAKTDQDAEPPLPSAPAPAGQVDQRVPAPDFFTQFESLGSDCMFGLVQRHFGVEPLGLLRWSAIMPRDLAAALRDKFAGVGEPEHTVLDIDRGEYRTKDSRYGMWMHTFVNSQSIAADIFYAQLCKRLIYLRRKLLADLAAGEKLFVYKYHKVDSADYEALADAISGYGPGWLLCLQLANAYKPAGTVFSPRDGLILGYMDRFTIGEDTGLLNFEGWRDICAKAHVIWKQGVAAP